MTTKKRHGANLSSTDDPTVTEAFVRLCAKLTKVSSRFEKLHESAEKDAACPLRDDLHWLTENIAPAELDDFAAAFVEHVNYQLKKRQILEHHVSAMKHLAKYMNSGYEVSSSHARSIVLGSISIHYFLSSSLTSEERVTRFAANLLEQAKYTGRISRSMKGALPT